MIRKLRRQFVGVCMALVLTVLFGYRTPPRATEAQMVSAGENARPQDMARGIDPTVSGVESAEDSPSRAAPDRALDSNAILSPVAGRLVNLEATGDPVFASRALGEGVGIQPTDSEVVAPVSGVLQTVAETGHAFGIKTDDGVEVLVHVGIDTVKMNGEGFAVKVKADERVNAGDPLVSVDFAKVKDAGYSTTTLMTVLNTAALTSVTPKTGIDVKAGDEVIDIQR